MKTESYLELNGVYVKFSATPCARCKYRYAYVCPMCQWNRFGFYNTYNLITIEKKGLKEDLKELEKNVDSSLIKYSNYDKLEEPKRD